MVLPLAVILRALPLLSFCGPACSSAAKKWWREESPIYLHRNHPGLSPPQLRAGAALNGDVQSRLGCLVAGAMDIHLVVMGTSISAGHGLGGNSGLQPQRPPQPPSASTASHANASRAAARRQRAAERQRSAEQRAADGDYSYTQRQHPSFHSLLKEWMGGELGARVVFHSAAQPMHTPSVIEPCLSSHLPPRPDLVLVEYAVMAQDARGFELLLRRLLTLPSRPAIIAVNTPSFSDGPGVTKCMDHEELVSPASRAGKQLARAAAYAEIKPDMAGYLARPNRLIG